MSAMEKTKTNTNKFKKSRKEKKSKIVGTKTKDKNQTGEKKLHSSFTKLQNFQVGENNHFLRNDKNKPVSH